MFYISEPTQYFSFSICVYKSDGSFIGNFIIDKCKWLSSSEEERDDIIKDIFK